MNRREFIKKSGVVSLYGFVFPLQVGRTTPETSIQVKQYTKERKKSSIPNHTNPSFRFDNFVVGHENCVAYCILKLEMAWLKKSQGHILNLHGPRGTGKSHLLHAYRNEMLFKHPDIKILNLHSERFSLLCHKSKIHGNFQELMQEFDKFDILILEDVQHVEGFFKSSSYSKMMLENAVFALLKRGGTFVYSSDLPDLVKSVYANMHNKSPFFYSSMGINTPSIQTRYGIVRMMTKKYKMKDKVSDEMCRSVAKVVGDAYDVQSRMRRLMHKLSL